MWDQFPEERNLHSIRCQESVKTKYVCTNRAIVRGRETALTVVQKGIMEAIIFFKNREKMQEENLKMAFTILHVRCTESIFSKMGGDSKYEAIKRDQNVI